MKDFNYSLGNQDKVGIIGEEGNGKSTFLKALYDPKWIENYMVMSGEIRKDVQHIGYLAQVLPTMWEEISVCDFLLKRYPEEDIPYERYNDLKLYDDLCQSMHVSRQLLQREQTMHTLSGGEKVKLQMLKLMMQPLDLLLLDEPTNDLDIPTLEWMETFIKECKIPVLFVSHDRELLQRCTNVIFHFEQLNHQSKCRATIFKGNYHDYVIQRNDKHQKELQRAKIEKQEYMKKKIRLNNQRNAVHDALNDTVRNPGVGALLKKKMTNIKAQERRFEKEGFTTVDGIEEALDIRFDGIEAHASKMILKLTGEQVSVGQRVLIYDVDLLLKGKDKMILVGDNGSGKSIFMNIVYEKLKNRSDIRVGYMPQNYQQQMDLSQTPIQFLMEEGDHDDRTRCQELLGVMKFTAEEMTHCIGEISEGQKAKLYIAAFIKRRCNVLLLDEPTRNLSPLSAPVMMQLLREYEGCILAVSHDRQFIKELGASIIKLENKHMIKDRLHV